MLGYGAWARGMFCRVMARGQARYLSSYLCGAVDAMRLFGRYLRKWRWYAQNNEEEYEMRRSLGAAKRIIFFTPNFFLFYGHRQSLKAHYAQNITKIKTERSILGVEI